MKMRIPMNQTRLAAEGPTAANFMFSLVRRDSYVFEEHSFRTRMQDNFGLTPRFERRAARPQFRYAALRPK